MPEIIAALIRAFATHITIVIAAALSGLDSNKGSRRPPKAIKKKPPHGIPAIASKKALVDPGATIIQITAVPTKTRYPIRI
jgi:hypothetical protein